MDSNSYSVLFSGIAGVVISIVWNIFTNCRMSKKENGKKEIEKKNLFTLIIKFSNLDLRGSIAFLTQMKDAIRRGFIPRPSESRVFNKIGSEIFLKIDDKRLSSLLEVIVGRNNYIESFYNDVISYNKEFASRDLVDVFLDIQMIICLSYGILNYFEKNFTKDELKEFPNLFEGVDIKKINLYPLNQKTILEEYNLNRENLMKEFEMLMGRKNGK